MPNLDQTGPAGAGPLTGRGFGPCAMGLRRGRGLGGFWGRRLPRFQKQDIKDYIKSLEEELEEAKKQLTDQSK